MFQATKAIYNELCNYDGLKVFTDESEDQSSVWLQFGLPDDDYFRIHFISKDESNCVAVRVFNLMQIEEHQLANALYILNYFNTRYRFLKFCCHDLEIRVEYDFLEKSVAPEIGAYEIICRMADLINEVYGVLKSELEK